MGIGKYCLNCGYQFHGQRTGKCPDCGHSAYQERDRFYHISPEDIRRFENFDKYGGDVFSLQFRSKSISVIQASPKNRWASLSVLGISITYADYGKGPEVIADLKNKDGFGINDIPEKLLSEAVQVANEIIHGH